MDKIYEIIKRSDKETLKKLLDNIDNIIAKSWNKDKKYINKLFDIRVIIINKYLEK